MAPQLWPRLNSCFLIIFVFLLQSNGKGELFLFDVYELFLISARKVVVTLLVNQRWFRLC